VSSARRRRSQPRLTRKLKITFVQWILGHAHLSTTELYLNTTPQDAIDDVLAYYQRCSEAKAMAAPPEPSLLRYRPEALDVLFGDSR
jgi:hypothetical protein